MSTKIKLKKSSVSGNNPDTSDLDHGELAINYADGRLWYKDASNNMKAFSDSERARSQALDLIDSDYVQLRQDYTYGSLTGAPYIPSLGTDYVDSATVLPVIDSRVDSAYVQLRAIGLDYNLLSNKPAGGGGGTGTLDSSTVLPVIDSRVDSDYVQLRQDYTYGSLTGTPTIPTFGTDFVDSAATNTLIDARVTLAYGKNLGFKDSAEIVTIADAATDQKVNKSYIQGFNFLDSGEVVTAANAAIDAKVTKSYGQSLGFLDSAEVVTAANARIDAKVDATFINALTIDADTLGGQNSAYHLNYNNFTNTPTIMDSGEVVTAANAAIDAKVTKAYIQGFDFLDSSEVVQASKDAVNKAYIQAFDFLDSGEVVTAANAAIDGKVNASYINALTIDADTLGGQNSAYHLNYNNLSNKPTIMDSAEVVTAANAAIDAKVTLSYGKALGFLDSAEVVQAAKDAVNKTYIQAFDFLDSGEVVTAANAAIDAKVDGTYINNLTIDADTLGGQNSAYHLNYNNFTNTPTIMDSAEVVTAANAAIDVKVDSDFIRALGSLDSTDLVPYVTLTGTQTVSNKTLTDPKIGASTQLYGQTYGGLSVNKDQTYGDSTETHLSIFSGDSSRDAALLIGVDNRTSHAIGNVQDRINNTNDLFIAVGDNASSIKFTRRALEGSVVNWTGVTPTDDLLMRIDNDGKIHVPKDTNATTRTAAAFTIAGGLGVDKDIRALDIYASNDLRAQGSIIGDVTGTVSSISNHNTNALSEGDSNLYYTTVRFDSDFGTKTTDNLTEGSTNLYYDSARTRTNARNSVSVNDAGGDGSLTYNASTGVLTYTGPSASDTRAHFTAGTGVTISNGEISIGQSVSTTDSVDFAGGTFTGNVSITGNLDVQGTQTINAYNDLRVTQPLIKVGDSNNTDTFDLGLVGRYSDDGGSTIRRAGFVRDATNGEWYVFSNLIQDGLDSSDPDKTIDFSHSSLELPIWNFGGLRGQYLGFDSDFQAFSTNYTLYTSSFTAVSAGRYALNSSGGSFNVTLPASPSSGDYVRLIDVGNFTDNSVTVLRNGSTIEGGTEDFELDIGQNIIEFLFINNTWNVYASIGQRGETGPTGPAADSADFVSPSKAIAFAIALG